METDEKLDLSDRQNQRGRHRCDQPRAESLDGIARSQQEAAECEARLFCEIASQLRYEIRRARCSRELERLVCLTNSFLAASAQKEAAIGEVIDSLGESC